jgi:Cu+-exporting ATPase
VTTTTLDPVCGMTVDPATAALTAMHDGKTYYFCAKGCQRAFFAAPAQHSSPGPADYRPR